MNLWANLSGKRALISGASSGFGEHFARVLAAAGAEVVLGARRAALLESVAAEIARAGGRSATVTLDVCSASCVSEAVGKAGAVDILVNCAGITNTKPALEQTESDWDSIIDTNLKGTWLLSTEVARAMRREQRPGSIINIASILGLRQAGHVSPYAVSKAGILQFTRQMALELARYQIRVNAIAPGYFATEMNRSFFSSAAGQKLVNRIPQRRLGTLEDLNGPLLLLASDASAFMTGSTIVVDGGHLVAQL